MLQVLNINSCVKIAVDFISCQCVRNALETTNELRGLSSTHENREDKLQLKSHIYHTGNFTRVLAIFYLYQVKSWKIQYSNSKTNES